MTDTKGKPCTDLKRERILADIENDDGSDSVAVTEPSQKRQKAGNESDGNSRKVGL